MCATEYLLSLVTGWDIDELAVQFANKLTRSSDREYTMIREGAPDSCPSDYTTFACPLGEYINKEQIMHMAVTGAMTTSVAVLISIRR